MEEYEKKNHKKIYPKSITENGHSFTQSQFIQDPLQKTWNFFVENPYLIENPEQI